MLNIIRQKRKTISISVDIEGTVTVKAPYGVPEREIRRFVAEKEDWIRETKARLIQCAEEEKALEETGMKLKPEELRLLGERAVKVIPERVRHYAPLVGVDYGRITIRAQKTRWGSCSSKGNLNFNCLLMLAPEEVMDSVVVHELCHRKEMNHSKAFYAEVLRVFPEYYKWNKWLKENGASLMMRLP